MIKVACCIPGTLPPETGLAPQNQYEKLLFGYQYLTSVGFDTVETSVGFVLDLTEEERNKLFRQKRKGAFEIAVCNCMLPSGYSITNAEDKTPLYRYLDNAFQKVSTLEIPMIVFGSGGARSLPEGKDPAECENKIFDFLTYCDHLGEKYGITVVLEPLNKRETNWVNTVKEAEKVVRHLALPHVRLLADGYHMAKENDDIASLKDVSDILAHTHLAEATKRHAPGTYDGAFEKQFLSALKQIGYQGIVTCECGFRNFYEDAPMTAAFMKAHLQ